MNFKKYQNYSVEDFVHDDRFLHWVLHPDQESDLFWARFLEEFPAQKQDVHEAVVLIKTFSVVEEPVSQGRLEKIFQNLQEHKKRPQTIWTTVGKIAAVVFFLLSMGGVVFYFWDDPQPMPFEMVGNETNEKGRLILPDGRINEFETEQTSIRQVGTGELTINNDTLHLEREPGKSEKATMAQVIIPYGKRSEITLADGTRIWLNAGSQLSYPVTFSGRSREVFLSGEAFFDVASNPEKSFQVITSDMKIQVTGTRFNVTSYAGDPTTQAVLVSGKINASRNTRLARAVEMAPGERLVYKKTDGDLEKDRVDVELYASWVSGYLIFENEPVNSIFKKLERYYNKKILVNKLSGQPTFSGKLDLADNPEKVLKNIAFSASFSVECKDDVFIINP